MKPLGFTVPMTQLAPLFFGLAIAAPAGVHGGPDARCIARFYAHRATVVENILRPLLGSGRMSVVRQQRLLPCADEELVAGVDGAQ